MPGDYSRDTFDRTKHFSRVLMQQGRVQLDADSNEQQAIAAHRLHTTATDIIGLTGCPTTGGGFEINLTEDQGDLTISTGRYYVGGLLCEQDDPNSTYLVQPDYYPEEGKDSAGNLSLAPGSYDVYLVAWEQEITAVTDPGIREVALGEADTTARLKVVWQVRLRESSIQDNTWNDLVSRSTGTLAAEVLEPEYTEELDNQLYRVEIHKGGDESVATFKWSRDNASVETRITDVGGTNLIVEDLGRDEVIGFSSGQWVEILDYRSEMNGVPTPLRKTGKVDRARNILTLNSDTDDISMALNPRVRRWDQVDGNQDGIAIQDGGRSFELDGVLKVTFSAGTYRTGDYWQIPVRAGLGVDLATRDDGNPIAREAKGPVRAFAKLATIKVATLNDGQKPIIQKPNDCRDTFPDLTSIAAQDIAYKNRQPGASRIRSVEDALNYLLNANRKNPLRVLTPQHDLQLEINSIPEGANAEIWFAPGEYVLSSTLEFTRKGHLMLRGGGKASRFVAANRESAFLFKGCSSVVVRDIHAETGAVVPSAHVNGTLSFIDCGRVDVANATLVGAGGAQRAGSCITVRSETSSANGLPVVRSILIQDCELTVGLLQIGILVVDAHRTVIRNNSIQVDRRLLLPTLPDISDYVEFRNQVRDSIVSNVLVTAAEGDESSPSGANVAVNVGNQLVRFTTRPELAALWAPYFAAHPPRRGASVETVIEHVRRAADSILLEPEARTPEMNAALEGLTLVLPIAMSQGIVIGGRYAEAVLLEDNTIISAAQGIHIGLSHSQDPAPQNTVTADLVGISTIRANMIETRVLGAVHRHEYHGIYLGSSRRVFLENNISNLVTPQGLSNSGAKGLHIKGQLGPQCRVLGNQVTGAPVGIRLEIELEQGLARALWMLAENVIDRHSKGTSIVIDSASLVLQSNNLSLSEEAVE